MPRDLEAEMPVKLTESPSSTLSDQDPPPSASREIIRVDQPRSDQSDMTRNIIVRPLTISDLESCVALENAAFTTEEERASREKFKYRLTKCGELSLGIFCTALPDSKINAETLKVARVVETSRPNGGLGVLLGHIVSTKSHDEVVTDNAMDYPKDWETSEQPSNLGHQKFGRTICLHSLGILPSYQGQGHGRTLLTHYLQQMNSAGIADRITLLAHEHLVPYYEKFGFENKGPSKAQFGGGGWFDMIYDLKSVDPRTAYE